MGRNDIEDALKRLDRLTQEEARMAAAQLLKITNTIDNRVGGIADNMLVVDNRDTASVSPRYILWVPCVSWYRVGWTHRSNQRLAVQIGLGCCAGGERF
jgi:hypothetical protein